LLAALPLLADTSISAPARRLTFTIRFSLLQYFVVFLVARSTAQAALVVLQMVPYVAAASCSGSGRTPREMAWGLALAAAAQLIDGKIGSLWEGGVTGDSCTTVCANAATGGCDADGLSEVGNEANFKEAKPEAMSCPDGYALKTTRSGKFTPFREGTYCWWGTAGTCDQEAPSVLRLCACKCGAGSYQPLSAPQRGIVSCQA
jgi:hypothetical protein